MDQVVMAGHVEIAVQGEVRFRSEARKARENKAHADNTGFPSPDS